MKKITCCKDCENRELGCHGSCEAYIQEKAKNDEFNRQVRLSKEILAYNKDHRLELRSRLLKKYGKI